MASDGSGPGRGAAREAALKTWRKQRHPLRDGCGTWQWCGWVFQKAASPRSGLLAMPEVAQPPRCRRSAGC